MALKKYYNILASGRWYNKDHKDDKILSIVGVVQKLADESKKLSERSNTSNMETTKGYPSYIRDILTWIPEGPNGDVAGKKRTEQNNGGARNNLLTKASGYDTRHKTTGSEPAPHQEAEEALRHQVRETSTRS